MKNKGFTLIELLAVIVVLAIIALIAIPMIVNVVGKSRKNAAVNSALGYLDAVEKYVVMHDLDSKKYAYELKNGTWYITKDTTIEGNTTPSLNTLVSVKGNKPSGEDSYVVVNAKGKVGATEGNAAEMIIGGYDVSCTSSTNCSAGGEAEATSAPDASQIGITVDGEETNVAAALDDLYSKLS